MNDTRIVIFDCDGVLFNTDRANRAYYNALLNHLNKPALTTEQFSFVHMYTVAESLRFLFPDAVERERANGFRKEMDYLPFIQDMDMEPGLVPLLSRLRPRFKTAIATNRTDSMDAVMTVHGLSDHFDLVVCARDVANPKPHPEPLLKILEYFEADPSHAVYIGDSEIDAQAAEGARIRFVSYRNDKLSADFHIQCLDALEGILNGRGPATH